MKFEKVCSLDDFWEGDLVDVTVQGHVIILVWPEGSTPRAFQGICPHQGFRLAGGQFDGSTLKCPAHQWTFDANTGKGINPDDCQLAEYTLKLDGDDVLVAVDGIEPRFSHS